MRSSLILILSLLIFSGCTQKSAEVDHLKKVTLKLAKPLTVRLSKEGSNSSNFNLIADVQNDQPILNANVKWILLDANEVKLSEKTESYKGTDKKLKFDSGNIEILNPELNHKIIFVFSGKTQSDEINKTEIYNSLIQPELEQALQNLQERAKNK